MLLWNTQLFFSESGDAAGAGRNAAAVGGEGRGGGTAPPRLQASHFVRDSVRLQRDNKRMGFCEEVVNRWGVELGRLKFTTN